MYASTSNGRWLNACARCVDNVHEEAAAWVARLDGRAAAPDERARFDDWLSRSSAHAAAYEEALRTWRDLAAMRSGERYQSLLGEPTLREKTLRDRKSTRLNSSHSQISYAVFCLKKKKNILEHTDK